MGFLGTPRQGGPVVTNVASQAGRREWIGLAVLAHSALMLSVDISVLFPGAGASERRPPRVLTSPRHQEIGNIVPTRAHPKFSMSGRTGRSNETELSRSRGNH
jgi:hypothetical protein